MNEQHIKIREKENGTYVRVVYYLIFLYPLLIINVRHWASVVFSILLVCTIPVVRKNNFIHLVDNKVARYYIFAVYLYFCMYIVSSTMGVDPYASFKSFDIDFRYLFIPFLIVIFYRAQINLKDIHNAIVLSLFVSLPFFIYEIFILDGTAYTTIYSRLFSGPITAIFVSFISIYLLSEHENMSRFSIIIVLLACCIALLEIAYSQSRASYLIVLLLFGYMLFINRGKYLYVLLSILIVISFSVYKLGSEIHQRIDETAISIAGLLLTNKDKIIAEKSLTAIETRIAMWEIIPYALSDNLLIGVGRNNYIKYIEPLVNEGKLNSELLKHSHAHNIYIDTLIAFGFVGLLIILFVIVYPGYLYYSFIKTQTFAKIGMLFHLDLLALGATETAILTKNNFNSIFILFSSLFLYFLIKHMAIYGDIDELEITKAD